MLKKLFSLFAALTLSVGLWAIDNEIQVVPASLGDCSVIAEFPYFNDFENFLEEKECWVSIDNDGDGQDWITGTLNYAGYNLGMGGTSICLISQSYENNVGAFNADNYLLTPEIVLPANKIVTLSWYAKSQDSDYPDWYEVMVAPNASTEISSFVSVFNEEGASDWTLHTVDLSAYAGTTIRVVFHHKDSDEYMLDIDNLGIECETLAPAVGDQFLDEDSDLKFEVTAVGDANTVKVIANSYTGTTYTIPVTVTYNDVDFTVTEIGEDAFNGCTSLESVTFLGNACQDAIGDNAFAGVGTTTPAALTLPENWAGSTPDEDGNWYGGKFELVTSALPTVKSDGQATVRKYIKNGRFEMEVNGARYNAVSQEVK